MGLDASKYTLHGFRQAEIQEDLLAEGNLALCKLLSDYSSDAILEYYYIPADRRLTISNNVNNSLAAGLFPPDLWMLILHLRLSNKKSHLCD